MNKIVSCVLLTVIASATGCSTGDMGSVSGTVTLDGKPLDRALVRFTPVNGDRGSIAQTDKDGNYSLQYSLQKSGARVGEHTVTITTAAEPVPDEDTGEYLPARAELLPTKYNVETELKATVKAGRNTFDWELDSEGEIFEQTYDDQDQ